MEKTASGTGDRLVRIDCDIHPRLPRLADLAPHASRFWAEMFAYRSIDRQELMAYPVSLLPQRPEDPAVQADAAGLAAAHLDPMGVDAAILNVLSGAHAAYDPYIAAAMCESTNRWLAAEWLDRDPRLRASALVPFQHPEAAVAEIERLAGDRRFVQILAILNGEKPLGRREYWPIYRAAAEHGFALAIHPGGNNRHAPTQSGFPNTRIEEAVLQPQSFASQVASLVAEGVFNEYPALRVVLTESGISWLPGLMWRMSKDWKGARIEVPWLEQPPIEYMTRHLRVTTQPFDGPLDDGNAAKVLDQLPDPGMLLWSSDFPHRHATRGLPHGLPETMQNAVWGANALATYDRLELSHG
ncbi:hydrolase [Pararhodobacter marinus]|uniref:Hydrolase n=2 Tax=Pararhodobacter marinus TaxID=2184063 RepID=A0A2U2CDA9_9RHOB|nr:hydrolase [Pararhodobacter marinus]